MEGVLKVLKKSVQRWFVVRLHIGQMVQDMREFLKEDSEQCIEKGLIWNMYV